MGKFLHFFVLLKLRYIKVYILGLHDNSNSDNSNSYENFQGALSQNTIWNWKKKTCQPDDINKDYDAKKNK